jgi:deoxyribodipyrimidine photo-lyase
VDSTNGGWQLQAGAATEAASHFRISIPILEGKKFDPRGVYLKVWLPELTDVPLHYQSAVGNAPAVQRQARCTIGRQYPAPIIKHCLAR